MALTLYQVDAFTDKPFGGNPAAICVLDEPQSAAWMQQLAAEMNLSETAFLERADDGSFGLRWFTPAVEVDLCGHATLASAHVLWELGLLAENETARFNTRSGQLLADRNATCITLNFPATPACAVAAPSRLLKALGVEALFAGSNGHDYLVQVASEKEVHSVNPDFGLLKTITERGVILTAEADTTELDFISRFFAPSAGIDEDPVTGSAHCTLGPFWADRLGKTAMRGYQASPRGGHVGVEVQGERVLLTGQAITVLKAEWLHA